MCKKLAIEWAPLACVLVALWILIAVGSGCAVSAQLMTDKQHRVRTMDRVLIDRSHGSYRGDDAITLDQYRKRYQVVNSRPAE